MQSRLVLAASERCLHPVIITGPLGTTLTTLRAWVTIAFIVHVRAPREQVFDLWTDLDRAHEWIEGLTRIPT